jgi:hypothetical protein
MRENRSISESVIPSLRYAADSFDPTFENGSTARDSKLREVPRVRTTPSTARDSTATASTTATTGARLEDV